MGGCEDRWGQPRCGPELPLLWRGLLVLSVSWNPSNGTIEIIFCLNIGKCSNNWPVLAF